MFSSNRLVPPTPLPSSHFPLPPFGARRVSAALPRPAQTTPCSLSRAPQAPPRPARLPHPPTCGLSLREPLPARRSAAPSESYPSRLPGLPRVRTGSPRPGLAGSRRVAEPRLATRLKWATWATRRLGQPRPRRAGGGWRGRPPLRWRGPRSPPADSDSETRRRRPSRGLGPAADAVAQQRPRRRQPQPPPARALWVNAPAPAPRPARAVRTGGGFGAARRLRVRVEGKVGVVRVPFGAPSSSPGPVASARPGPARQPAGFAARRWCAKSRRRAAAQGSPLFE